MRTTNKVRSAEEAQVIAQEAYIYFYPLVSMDVTRKQLTNLDPKATTNAQAAAPASTTGGPVAV
jgi:hypothetical protein